MNNSVQDKYICIVPFKYKIDVKMIIQSKQLIRWTEILITDISLRYQKGRGTCVLLILDFSESMQGEGIRSLKRGVSDILNGLSPVYQSVISILIF